MTPTDLAVIAKTVAPIVREFVAMQMQAVLAKNVALEQRLHDLEQREPIRGADGKDAAPVDLALLAFRAAALVDTTPIAEKAAALVVVPTPKDGAPGQDGKDAPPVDLAVVAQQAAALIAVPTVDIEAIASKAAALVGTPEKGEKGEPGQSVDPATVAAIVDAAVTKAMDARPAPKDGQSVTVDDVAPLIASEVQKAVAAIPPAQDGVGVVDALIDRQGHLIVTLSNGQTKDVGPIVGRDGTDVDRDELATMVAEEVAKIPRPKDGVNGKDGVGWDDMAFDEDADGRLLLKFVKGDIVKTVLVPCVVDRGVWRHDTAYRKGDGVTWNGSWWIARLDDPKDKPGTKSDEWRLTVKNGDKGRPGADGKPGEPGRPGRDVAIVAPSPFGGRP